MFLCLLSQNESSGLLPVNPDGSRSVDRDWDQSETWRQMEEVYASGKVKAIGVANWSIPYLEELKKTWKIVPAVNQVELHPFLPQHKLVKYCRDLGILLEAYSPLGSTSEFESAGILRLNKDPIDICIHQTLLSSLTPKSTPLPRNIRRLPPLSAFPIKSTGVLLFSPNLSLPSVLRIISRQFPLKRRTWLNWMGWRPPVKRRELILPSGAGISALMIGTAPLSSSRMCEMHIMHK